MELILASLKVFIKKMIYLVTEIKPMEKGKIYKITRDTKLQEIQLLSV